MKRAVYLDYAAATPLDTRVLDAMKPYFSERFHNPSATYLAGRQARQALESARASVAKSLGAKKSEVIFTAGATEANNLAIQGVMRQFPEGEALVSSIEHESVLQPAGLFAGHTIPVTADGRVDLPKFQKLLNPKTVLISVMLVNNELGSIQPISEIAGLVKLELANRQKRKNSSPLYLHTDAAQAGNFHDMHVSRLGADMMSINGGKIYGPKQTGALFVKTGVRLTPIIIGGGQEFGLRSGTEHIAGAVGLAKALSLAQEDRTKTAHELAKLRIFFATLLQKEIKTSVINGSTKYQAPHLLSVTFPGLDNERLMMELDEQGIQCAVGSACSASNDRPSHVLAAIGLSDEAARSTLRFSLGRGTTKADINYTVERLAGLTVRHR